MLQTFDKLIYPLRSLTKSKV